jgi:nucleosome binding factor SPN SPT16 subunit
MKEGVQAREVYQHAISFIKEKKPELEKHFVKTVGFGVSVHASAIQFLLSREQMGMEFRDATYVLSPKNSRVLKANMTFNLGLGFSDLTDSNGQKYGIHSLIQSLPPDALPRYALHLVDTVRIDTNKAVLLTDGVKHSKETLFFLDSASGEDDVKAKKPPARPKANGSPSKAKTVAGKVLRNPRRAAQDDVHQTASARLMEHQKEIHQRLQEDGIARFSDGGGGTAGKEGKSWKKFNSYKGEGALPDEVEKLRVWLFSFHSTRSATNLCSRYSSIAKHRR